jgi:hypothetical protein
MGFTPILWFLLLMFEEEKPITVGPIKKTSRREDIADTYARAKCTVCGVTLFFIYFATFHSNYYLYFQAFCNCSQAATLFTEEVASAGRIWWYINLQRQAIELQSYAYFPSKSMRSFCRWYLRQKRPEDVPSRQWYSVYGSMLFQICIQTVPTCCITYRESF